MPRRMRRPGDEQRDLRCCRSSCRSREAREDDERRHADISELLDAGDERDVSRKLARLPHMSVRRDRSLLTKLCIRTECPTSTGLVSASALVTASTSSPYVSAPEAGSKPDCPN